MSEQENSNETKSKAELFAENPDRFEDLTECVLVIKRTEKENGKAGMSVMVQAQSDNEAILAKEYAKRALDAFSAQLAMRSAQSESRIVTPNGVRPPRMRDKFFGKK